MSVPAIPDSSESSQQTQLDLGGHRLLAMCLLCGRTAVRFPLRSPKANVLVHAESKHLPVSPGAVGKCIA